MPEWYWGVSESLDEARGVSEAYAKPERTEKAFECAQKYNFGKYNSLSGTTPDEKINHIMNQWLKKQIDCCIVGKKGVRDNLQIAVALWSWTTGTSAWCMNGLYEGIMGVKRRYDGLEISLCFPAEWNHAEMTRHFRNADYHIIIENPQHIESGKPIVSVDGVQIEGNRLPDFADGSRHEVKVVLR